MQISFPGAGIKAGFHSFRQHPKEKDEFSSKCVKIKALPLRLVFPNNITAAETSVAEKGVGGKSMKHIYVSIPEATDIKYIVLRQLRGFILVNRLAAPNCQAPVLRIDFVHPKILTWLHEQYRLQRAEAARGLHR